MVEDFGRSGLEAELNPVPRILSHGLGERDPEDGHKIDRHSSVTSHQSGWAVPCSHPPARRSGIIRRRGKLDLP